MSRSLLRLSAILAIVLSSVAMGNATASADGLGRGGCFWSWTEWAKFDTCFFGVEVGARNNSRLEFILIDGPVQDGVCTKIWAKYPGDSVWTYHDQRCVNSFKTFNIPVKTFFGKVDVMLCGSFCTRPFQLAV